MFMQLDENVNYIVSGLERSGTSMLMQILIGGDIPTLFDDSRKPDKDNPKGYYELGGGKIINRVIEGSFPFEEYRGRFIKITAYGLRYLPKGNYKIIYTERNIDEVLDSMEAMIGKKDANREKTRQSFMALNKIVKRFIKERDDLTVCFVNYNDFLSRPRDNINKIIDFLGISDEKLEDMVNVVDKRLYRMRR
jgi:hypothetical protein